MLTKAVYPIVLAACALCSFTKVSANPTVVSLPSYSIEIDGKDGQTKFFEHNILSGINATVDPCKNAYPSTCNDDGNFLTPTYLKKVYSHIRTHLINVLSSSPSENEIKLLSVEKKLFQDCMKLGSKEDAKSKSKTRQFVELILRKFFSHEESWQSVDKDLNVFGLGDTFFDFTIENDPENQLKKIIVLQPPSYNRIKGVSMLLESALKKNYLKRESDDDYIWNFYNSINSTEKRLVLEFFDKWVEAFSPNDYAKSETVKVSIKKWNNLFRLQPFTSTGSIDWFDVISSKFKYMASIDENRVIFVKNKPYFLQLIDILGETSNDIIESVIKTKIITENLRYIDWKKAESLQHVKRSTFCFEDTKLYGASFRMLRDLKKFESNQAEHFKTVKDMLDHIVRVTKHEIGQSKTLSHQEKKYLQYELKSITSDAVNHKKYIDELFDYYDTYAMTPSYFVNIIEYRRMVKEDELNYLNANNWSDTTMKILPFSITDLEKPRNRFILSVFVYSYSPFLQSMPKEVHYATYGVKIASTLFALLNEDRLNSVTERKNTDWFTHPVYSKEAMKCFLPEHLENYDKALATTTLTEIFGLRIAFKAMLQEYLSQASRQFYYNSRSSDLIITADQLFFITYAKFHCHSGEKVINAVLQNSNEFYSAYNCYERNIYQPNCQLRGFQLRAAPLSSTENLIL